MADAMDSQENGNTREKSMTARLAWENCCAQQVLLSMFDKVADLDPQALENRSDQDEIKKFCNTLLESEFIFGSPDQKVLESVDQKMTANCQNSEIAKRG